MIYTPSVLQSGVVVLLLIHLMMLHQSLLQQKFSKVSVPASAQISDLLVLHTAGIL